MEETAEEIIKRFNIVIPYEDYIVEVCPEFMEMYDEHLRRTVEEFKYNDQSICPVDIIKKHDPQGYCYGALWYAEDLIYKKMMPQEMIERIEITSISIDELAGLQSYP